MFAFRDVTNKKERDYVVQIPSDPALRPTYKYLRRFAREERVVDWSVVESNEAGLELRYGPRESWQAKNAAESERLGCGTNFYRVGPPSPPWVSLPNSKKETYCYCLKCNKRFHGDTELNRHFGQSKAGRGHRWFHQRVKRRRFLLANGAVVVSNATKGSTMAPNLTGVFNSKAAEVPSASKVGILGMEMRNPPAS